MRLRTWAAGLEKTISRVRARASTARWRLSLAACGNNVLIGSGARFAVPGRAVLGANVFLGSSACISAHGGITIEDDVMVGPFLNVQAGNHQFGPDRRFANATEEANPHLRIGKGAWIGSRVTILAGADIGEYAVVAAGAVVTRPVEPWTLVGGVPAVLIRRLSPEG